MKEKTEELLFYTKAKILFTGQKLQCGNALIFSKSSLENLVFKTNGVGIVCNLHSELLLLIDMLPCIPKKTPSEAILARHCP
ncbi:hypothetical protein MTR67_017034 [Solanum verrucosum]|uniref:Uncharacterized protein n=1 Tax=Solanum verrucosum TaxID=315347 RepID=A0AAF0TLH2_SOLVR|nr:hypothetical protein MTR67_017034 [Solanum verrucosum]